MITLKGKNLVKVVCLDESVIALGRNGSLYHLSSPELGPKGWTSNLHGMIHYPKDMGWFEKVIDISAGKNHALAVSNSNNVFSCSSNENGNQFGQLGIKGESQPGQLSRIPFFKDLDIAKAVAGFNHSLVVTKDGRIFGFGSNSLGQLGLDDLLIGEKIESPLEVKSVWSMDGKSSKPINMKCTDIAAGGDTSIFVINTLDEKQFEPIKSSVYSCGSGQYGQLGNGGFFHAGIRPSLLKPLSGLQEYNETLQKSTPIHLESITIGPTHGVGILKNMNSEYGKTTLFWGHQHAILRADKKKSHCPTPIEGVPLTSPVADETFQLAPLHLTKFVNGSRKADQGIAIGVFDTAIYSKVY
ncbi:regulator of chromosome condensation 1/beta-lactamase-inhibitor protein II [Globomyces pollinis-pini]|nr:regulator of chromosome condensation 1/beta-lactamase-inhibitor protein II [Globomyces pollinis-pini]